MIDRSATMNSNSNNSAIRNTNMVSNWAAVEASSIWLNQLRTASNPQLRVSARTAENRREYITCGYIMTDPIGSIIRPESDSQVEEANVKAGPARYMSWPGTMELDPVKMRREMLVSEREKCFAEDWDVRVWVGRIGTRVSRAVAA